MKFVDRVFDAGFDDIAIDSPKLQPWRLLVSLVVAGLVVSLLGPWVGFVWGGALGLSELWTRTATARFAGPRPPRGRDRVNYLGAMVALNATWVALSVLFWACPAPWSPTAAMIVWASLLLSGLSVAFRSRMALIPLAGPASVAMVAVPALIPRFDGAAQTLIVIGLLVCVLYAWLSARRTLIAADALASATAELAAQKQAAEAANLAKSSFLAMMSHEMRTPMNGVLGMAHALELTELDSRQRSYVGTLIQSGDGLMAVLDDVLDLARIETGRLDIQAEPFDLRDAVTKAHSLWLQAAADKGLVLACDIQLGAPGWVTGDPVRVRQILLNLLSNAIKFTEVGEVRIALEAASCGAVVSVSDTGPGLDAATREGLFQSFTPADASVVRRHGGAGLGLAISQDLARLMGGAIEVESEPGQGSVFRLRLPLSPAPPQGVAEPAPPDIRRLEILVVDDNATNRKVASALLEALGCAVTTASGGPEALAVLGGRSFDLVLMDIHMPAMDGVEVTRRIREGEALDPEAPIIALTADAMAGQRERLLALGFDDYLAKPVSPEVLAKALSRVRSRDD